MKFAYRLLFLGLLTLLVAFGQPHRSSKLAPELGGLEPGKQVDVIVKFNQMPSDSRRSLATRRGGEMVRSLDVINSHHYRLSAARLAELADDPTVDSIQPDQPIQATGT